MDERDFFNEKDEIKVHDIRCPSCGQDDQYKVRWRTRTRKNSIPGNSGEDARARFKAARDYMVRIDDVVACTTPRCGKRIEITSLQSVVIL